MNLTSGGLACYADTDNNLYFSHLHSASTTITPPIGSPQGNLGGDGRSNRVVKSAILNLSGWFSLLFLLLS